MMPQSLECVILIGLPASGKSTFYRERFSSTHDVVSKDAMRHTRQPQRRQEELIDASLAAGRSVVVDNTNPRAADRADRASPLISSRASASKPYCR